jgi:glycosyltransferase involved in cell wall biosynthesis
MTDRPLVSIVTPTLNQGAFIEATIRSIQGQTYDRYEHIVVDGGSTDGALDILRRHEETYPMQWVSEPDTGMYAAVNKGLTRATGEIHAYLNSDDLYFPWTIETAAAFLEAHPEVDLVYGDAINIDHVTRREHVRVMPPFDLERLTYVWPLTQPAAFWRARVTRELGGFDETLKYIGDWDFFIRAGQRFRVAKIDEFLAVERRHLASKTIGQSTPMQLETRQMLARYQEPTSTLHTVRRRFSAYAARRVAWMRLLRAVRAGPRPGEPWSRLLAASNVRLSIPRLAAGFVPWSPQQWKAGSVDTGVDWLAPS